MINIPKRTFWVLLGVYAAAFLVFFAISIFSYHSISVAAKELDRHGENQFRYTLLLQEHTEKFPLGARNSAVLSSFTIRWIVYNTVILFSRYMLALTLTGILLCYSLIFPYQLGDESARISFLQLIGKNIILFLVLTVVYVSLYEGVSPSLRKAQYKMAADTDIALKFYHTGLDSMKAGKYSDAHAAFSSFLVLDKDNKIIKEAFDWTAAQMVIKPAQSAAPDITVSVVQKMHNFTDAENYFKNKDYFSAYYYAFLASETDEKNLKEKALRLMAESENKISSLRALVTDKKKRVYFQRKMNAVDALKSGRYYNAYYAFKQLVHDFPGDMDMKDFFNKSRDAVTKDYFFVDEIKRYSGLPGINNIIYLQKNKQGDSVLVKIKKFIRAEDGEYFFSIEVLEFSPKKGIIEHFTAPYGKLSKDGYIIFKAIGKNEKKEYSPTYLIKSSGVENRTENISAKKLLPHFGDLVFLQRKGMQDGTTILELFNMWRTVGKYGYLTTPLEISLIGSILFPFTFFIFSLFAISIGWFFRIWKRRMPLFTLLLVPLLPFVIHKLFLLYLYSAKGFYAFFLFKTGFTVSLVILFSVQAALLFWALLEIARQNKR